MAPSVRDRTAAGLAFASMSTDRTEGTWVFRRSARRQIVNIAKGRKDEAFLRERHPGINAPICANHFHLLFRRIDDGLVKGPMSFEEAHEIARSGKISNRIHKRIQIPIVRSDLACRKVPELPATESSGGGE